jgi:septum formation protein
MPEKIVLASSSPFRKSLLTNAGIAFTAVKPDVDERAAEAPLKGSGATPEDVALVLATAKAAEVSERNPQALVIGSDQTLWSHVAVARLTMRKLEPAFIGRYLARVGDKALASVGAYQIEGEGIQLFEKIEGDYFTIVGLPLVPLLAALRELGAIDG